MVSFVCWLILCAADTHAAGRLWSSRWEEISTIDPTGPTLLLCIHVDQNCPPISTAEQKVNKEMNLSYYKVITCQRVSG